MCGAVVSWGWRKRKLKWRLRGKSSLKKSFKWELRDGCDKFTYKMKDWAWKEEKEKFQYGNEYFGISLNVYSCLVWSWWFYSTKSGTFLYHFRPRPRTPFPIRCQGYSNSLSNEYDEVKNGFLSITLHIQHSIFFSYKVWLSDTSI